jgi:DNA-binding GntR family transcriptional regulator
MLAAKVTDEDKRRMRAFVAEEREAYDAGRMEDARHLARRFHLLLTELAGNDVLTGFLRDLINRQPLLSWTRKEQKPRFCGTGAHAAIVEAVAAGKGEEAARLNAEHLRELEQELDEDRGAAIDGPNRQPEGYAGDSGRTV